MVRIKANRKKKKARIDNSRKLVNFLFEAGTLRKTMRSHRQALLTDDLSDNIAAHSYRVTLIGALLARLEGGNRERVMLMCLLHDLEETRSGDQNWVHRKYVRTYEPEIARDQLAALPGAADWLKLDKEFSARQTLESKLAKDADLLDQVFILCEYAWQGNKEAQLWLDGGEQEKRMFTKTAKKLAKRARTQRPSDWWDNYWSAKRR